MFTILFSKYYLEIKWSLFFLMMSLSWVWAEKLCGLHDIYIQEHAMYTNLMGIPAVLIYFLAMWEKRKNLDNVMSFKQAFMYGLSITLIVVALSPFMTYISFTLITPHFFEYAIQFSVKQGYMNSKDAFAYFSLDSYILQSVFGGFIMGLITTAITAFIMKSSPVSIKKNVNQDA